MRVDTEVCAACGGNGTVSDLTCLECLGSGVLRSPLKGYPPFGEQDPLRLARDVADAAWLWLMMPARGPWSTLLHRREAWERWVGWAALQGQPIPAARTLVPAATKDSPDGVKILNALAAVTSLGPRPELLDVLCGICPADGDALLAWTGQAHDWPDPGQVTEWALLEDVGAQVLRIRGVLDDTEHVWRSLRHWAAWSMRTQQVPSPSCVEIMAGSRRSANAVSEALSVAQAVAHAHREGEPVEEALLARAWLAVETLRCTVPTPPPPQAPEPDPAHDDAQ